MLSVSCEHDPATLDADWLIEKLLSANQIASRPVDTFDCVKSERFFKKTKRSEQLILKYDPVISNGKIGILNSIVPTILKGN